mgnify:CR=1 FL=1
MAEKHPVEEINFEDAVQEDKELEEYIETKVREIKESNSYKEPPPVFEMNWSNRVIVSNLPVVGNEKKDLLVKVIAKVLSKAAHPIDTQAIEMPMQDNSSQGFVFITYPNEEEAKTAVQKCNGINFDKKHQITVVSLEEFQRLMETPDEYKEPRIYSQSELKSWLTDSRGRDQFVVRFEDKTKVLWNDQISGVPELVSAGPEDRVWTDRFVKWSSQGTYLATLHSRGVVIWGGPGFEEMMRFSHNGVSNLEFSPCERYLLTYSGGFSSKYIVWDLMTGEDLRTFSGSEEPWGVFKWNFDGNYIARKGEEFISLFETPGMGMVEDPDGNKVPIAVPDLVDFAWSPTQNLISFNTKEREAKPASIRIMKVPSREIVSNKMLFDVLGCKMHWQSNGEYLVNLITTKHKNSTAPKDSQLQTFFIKKKGIPVDTVTLPNTVVIQLAWEPASNKFAVNYSIAQLTYRVDVYQIQSDENLKKVGEAETRNRSILWAPQGGNFITFNYPQMKQNAEGKITFHSLKQGNVYEIDEKVHMNMNHVEWDPSGRYLISAYQQDLSTHSQPTQGSGFVIWTCQGVEIYTGAYEKFYQISWRPRPKSMLSEEDEKKVEASLTSLAEKYEQEDRKAKREAREAREKERAVMKEEFFSRIEKYKKRWEDTASERASILGSTDEESRQRWKKITEPVKTIIKVETKLISSK